jgi:hypothetical protein
VTLGRRPILRQAAAALALLAAAAAPALGSPQQVLEDYGLDGRIDGGYSVHDLRGALVLPATGSQYGSFADAVQAKLTEVLAGSQPPASAPPASGSPQYGAAPASTAPASGGTERQGARTPAPTPAPSPSPRASPQPAARPAPASPPASQGAPASRRPRGQRLVNRVEDLGSEVLAPAVVVPPRLSTFPTPPSPSSEQRLPRTFVPLAALAALLLGAGIVSGLWRSLRPGGGRRNGRRRVERLRLGD